MSSEKKYTGRDLVMAKREGFLEAHSWARVGIAGDHEAERLAATKYPLPKRTQPRVVTPPGRPYDLRIHDGNLQIRNKVAWAHIFHVTGVEAILLDLIANPTEEVEDEE
jgi:hypothetical protein